MKINGGIILILEYSCMVQEGRRIAISKSNTKNKIITRKNLVENDDLFLEISLKPHSNCVFFSIKYLWLCEVIVIVIIRKAVKINERIMNDGKFISFISF